MAILGLTYKAGTSTLRRSAALQLVDRLRAAGASAAGFDPLARLDELPPGAEIELAGSVEEAAAGADALVLVAPWKGIGEVDWRAVASRMRTPRLVDTGNHLAGSDLAAAGFDYVGVGRPRLQRSRG